MSDLLNHVGSKLLIHELPSIFDGSAKVKACLQDDSKATLAPKVLHYSVFHFETEMELCPIYYVI